MKIKILVLFTILNFYNVFAQPLNGSYSVGSVASDFLSVDAAITSLNTNGVSGPVIFNIESGTYTVHSAIGAITGASAINNVTFQSQIMDSTAVILQYSASGSGANYILQLNASQFINFSYLTFKTNGSSYKTALDLNNLCNHIQINNCYFESVSTINSSSAYTLIVADGHGVSNIKILNNRFNGGGSHINLIGTFTNPGLNNEISGNKFEGSVYFGVTMRYCNSAVYSSNIHLTSNFSHGANFEYCDDGLIIEKNQFKLTKISSAMLSLIIDSSDGSYSNHCVVRNNFFANGINVVAISIQNSTYVDVLNNSLKAVNTASTNLVSMFGVNLNHVRIYNNIFYNNKGNLFSFYDLIDTNKIKSDYNVFFYEDSLVFKPSSLTSVTFNSWQNTYGLDAHSFYSLPIFVSPTDLHLDNSMLLNGAGIPHPSVADDIDSETRDIVNPDIGADEFGINYSTYRDLELIGVYSPNLDSCSVQDSVTVMIRNNSTFQIDSWTVFWQLFDLTQDSLEVVLPIGPGDTILYTFTNFNFIQNTLYKMSFTVHQPNGMIDHNPNNNTYLADFSYYDNVGVYQYQKPDCNNDTELYIKNIPHISLLWSTGATTPSITVSTPGTYSITITAENGCVYNASTIVN